jgi:hypothetical protein
MKTRFAFLLLTLGLHAAPGQGAEELVSTAHYASGEPVPYILNTAGAAPKYLVILFPGGAGNVDPRMENGKLVYGYRGNFLVRSRHLIVDEDFATVTTNTTHSAERVQVLLDDLKRRYPEARVYLMGTSNGTSATVDLAAYLSERIAGLIHTASLNKIGNLDAKRYKNRHLVVHHKSDQCRHTTFYDARASHERFGNEFIAMEGGISVGEVCEARAHHGFNGIERETIDAIKQWIRRGG